MVDERDARNEAETEAGLRDSLRELEERLGPDHPDLLPGLTGMGWLLTSQGRAAEGVPWVQRALAIARAAFGEANGDTAQVLAILAQVEASAGAPETVATARAALAAIDASLGGEHPAVADVMPLLRKLAVEPELDDPLHEALDHLREGRPEQASALLEPLVAALPHRTDFDVEEAAMLCGVSGQALFLSGDHDAGMQRIQRGIDIAVAGRNSEAEESLRAQLVAMQGALGGAPGGDPDVDEAMAHLREGRFEEAERLLAPRVSSLDDDVPVEVACGVLALLGQAVLLAGRTEEGLDHVRAARARAAAASRAEEAEALDQLLAEMQNAASGRDAGERLVARVNAAGERLQRGEIDEAFAEFGTIAAEAERLGAPGPEASARVALGQIHRGMGRLERAREEFRKALAIADRLGDAESRRIIQEMMDAAEGSGGA